MQKELLTPRVVAAIGEAIDHNLAGTMIRTSVETHPDAFKAVTIGRNIIAEILAQPGCAGMRFYDAINEEGQKTLVYVGVDASGNNMLEKVVVDQAGAISTIPAIVADRGLWETIWTTLTGGK